MSNKATAKWTKELPAKCGWYYMRDEGQEPIAEGLIVWVGHNRSGVRYEGQFFYADSSFLKRREFLGPITIDAVAEVGRLREALEPLQGFDFRLDDSPHGKEMPMLSGLPGTDGKPRDGEMFSSVSRAFDILRRGLAATTAGDTGAINFYVRDDGLYHCEVMRHMVTEDSKQFKTQKDARAWLKKWLPKIQ